MTRPFRSSTIRRAVAAACTIGALVVESRVAAAQGATSREGALFLLVPIGARAVGMGQAVVATEPGSEAIWWNPASLARLERTEVAINHSSSIVGSGDALVLVLPRRKAGVIALAAYLLNYGQQEATDEFGTIGTLYPSSVIVVASYAATFGSRVSAGISYKFLQDRRGCSGACSNIVSYAGHTNAFDFGIQLAAGATRRLTFGAAVRNLGFALQINDVEQADPLPTRLHLGAQYALPTIERAVKDAELRVSAEIVDRLALGSPSLRVGGEFAFRKQFFLRAGYVSGGIAGHERANADAGIAIGLGVQRGGLSVDFARSTAGISADAGSPPTYVTLRVRF